MDVPALPHDEYSNFLFGIVHQFTNLEIITRSVLQIKSGLRKEYFDALFGMPSLNAAATNLTKLYKIDPHPDHQVEILSSLEQLKTISRLRNWMVHGGGHPVADGGHLVHLNPNEISVATGQSYHIFTRNDLTFAIRDLLTISAIIGFLGTGQNFPNDRFLQDNLPWQFKLPGIQKA
jgi:hypothetical protein